MEQLLRELGFVCLALLTAGVLVALQFLTEFRGHEVAYWVRLRTDSRQGPNGKDRVNGTPEMLTYPARTWDRVLTVIPLCPRTIGGNPDGWVLEDYASACAVNVRVCSFRPVSASIILN